jgi:hypothetical protein
MGAMTTIFNLRASNNSTFRWTRDLSQWATVYNIDAATIRMQARLSPMASSPVVYEWSSNAAPGSGSIPFDAGTNLCVFLAPLSDMGRMSKPLYYDCRLEFEIGTAVVMFSGRILWTPGLTRADSDGAAIGTSGIGDTVSVDGESSGAPVPLPLSLTGAVAAAAASASAAATLVASISASTLAAQIAALPKPERAALFQALIGSAEIYSGSGPAPVPTGEAFINDSNFVVVAG